MFAICGNGEYICEVTHGRIRNLSRSILSRFPKLELPPLPASTDVRDVYKSELYNYFFVTPQFARYP